MAAAWHPPKGHRSPETQTCVTSALTPLTELASVRAIMTLEDILSAAILLFLVMDPLGNIPLFLTVLERVPESRRQRIIARELIIALVALILFLVVGGPFLDFAGIRQESLSVAGGIVVFLIALRMIFPTGRSSQPEEELAGEPFVVPLAIPLVAGPSAFATLLLLSRQATTSTLLLALLVAWAATAAILLASTGLRRFLGRRGLIAMERLMGMVLVALAVQMFLDGLKVYFG